jgi:hypothetical protein
MRSFLVPPRRHRALKTRAQEDFPGRNGAEKRVLLFGLSKGQPMKMIAILLSMLVGGFAFAQGGAGGSATGGASNNSASPGGTAGTNVNGTNQTNQGNSYGNTASGPQTEGTNRNPTNSINDNSVSQTTGNPGIQSGKVK